MSIRTSVACWIKDGVHLICALGLYLLRYKAKDFGNDLWLIGERPAEAKDNGVYVFRWIRRNHPEKQAFYIIDKQASQCDQLVGLGNILDYNSLLHYVAFFYATKIVMPFERSGFPRAQILWLCYRLGLLRKKFIFLQHGVTKDYCPHLAYGSRFKFDAFVCSVDEERKYLLSAMNYPKTKVHLVGMARFDGLVNKTKEPRTIFYMPTWRTWLHAVDDAEIQSSTYVAEIRAVLSSKKLKALLERENITLILKCHDLIHHRIKNPLDASASCFRLASVEDDDIQQLLCSSSALITDYSSVAFDFAFLRKPIIYYQFDYERYRALQFREGWFSYENNGFGPVVRSIDALEASIESVVSGNFHVDQKYRGRMDLYAPVATDSYSKRNFELIDAV